MDLSTLSLDIATLRAAYLSGRTTPALLIDEILKRIAASTRYQAWISVRDREALLQDAARLNPADMARLPLYGIPFAIKDNIDLAGMDTTAGCPAFAYAPPRSATLVERMIAAGAIPIGKNNMDQFAAGLVGTRSPYGPCHNAFDFEHVSGGSSSGSAVAVALGLVSFALATDTAGSGRVPAAFNNLVGVKPTRGIMSTAGIFSACASISCPALFALNVEDARLLFELGIGRDEADPYTRDMAVGVVDFSHCPTLRFGVPRAQDLQFFGNEEYARLFQLSVEKCTALGGTAVEISLQPLLEAARLLYDGPWIAERWEAVGQFAKTRPEAVHPVTLSILQKGAALSGPEIFTGLHRLQALRLEAEAQLREVDFVLTPTAGTHPLIADVLKDPVRLNTQLGYYTNFMNLLDFAALAIPAGFTTAGLPFGVTLFAPAFADRALLGMAQRFESAQASTMAESALPTPPVSAQALPPDYVEVVVCGAHMAGLALNKQLTERGGYLVRAERTAPIYRFYLLPGSGVQRPGLIRVAEQGQAIDTEVWALPAPSFASFVAGIPAPLGIGKVRLEDGSELPGFICEGYAAQGARDITALGGWRQFLAESSA